MVGKIHSIDTFCTIDGPGLRFTVFMQGCPLKCKYCHNRDTWNINLGKDMTPEELIREVVKYKSYYGYSNGGLTVSGGEPFYQPAFLLELLKLAKKNDIHTCVDTSGYVNLDIAKPILDYTDLILLDIKHIDDNKCIDLTSKSINRAKTFAQYLDERNIPVWIRHVLVPGITDNEEDLKKLGEFINSLHNVQQLDILQYHTLGKFKWKELGLEYPLEGIREANDEDIKRALNIINKGGK